MEGPSFLWCHCSDRREQSNVRVTHRYWILEQIQDQEDHLWKLWDAKSDKQCRQEFVLT